jgi:hypothetical protein
VATYKKINEDGSFSMSVELTGGGLREWLDVGPVEPLIAVSKTCEDCKGRGTIQLFTTTEKCRKCGGKGVC